MAMQGVPDETGRASPSGERGAADATEDFLFHLYRGGELLQDNRLHEAREELEAALHLDPRDPKVRDLLGDVSFRLGLYPRAISIYEDLARELGSNAPLTLNLALCYVKTGQMDRALELLQEIVAAHPEDARARSYLGLVRDRLGKPEAVPIAGAARRELERLEPPLSWRPAASHLQEAATSDTFQDIDAEITLVGMAALPRVSSLPPRASPAEPPRSARPSSGRSVRDPAKPGDGAAEVPSLAALAHSSRLSYPAEAGVIVHPSGLVLCRVVTSFAVRVSAIAQLAPGRDGFKTTALRRRMRNRALDEALGGEDDPLLALVGNGGMALVGDGALGLLALRMDDDFLFVRETALVAFDTALTYENGRLAAFEGESVALVQLRGQGAVVLRARGALVSTEVRAEQTTICARGAVLGWAGRLLPRELSPDEAPLHAKGLIAFAGEGTVLASAGVPMNTP
jgi:uncharacterized protein (AIM24 family)